MRLDDLDGEGAARTVSVMDKVRVSVMLPLCDSLDVTRSSLEENVSVQVSVEVSEGEKSRTDGVRLGESADRVPVGNALVEELVRDMVSLDTVASAETEIDAETELAPVRLIDTDSDAEETSVTLSEPDSERAVLQEWESERTDKVALRVGEKDNVRPTVMEKLVVSSGDI